jgi:hypothetical protein
VLPNAGARSDFTPKLTSVSNENKGLVLNHEQVNHAAAAAAAAAFQRGECKWSQRRRFETRGDTISPANNIAQEATMLQRTTVGSRTS